MAVNKDPTTEDNMSNTKVVEGQDGAPTSAADLV